MAGVWLLVGCRERAIAEQANEAATEVVVTAVQSKRSLEVGVSGCSGLVRDPKRGLVCLTRKPKPLHLWLDGATDPKVELRFDGEAVEAQTAIDPDGLMVSVELPKQEGRLELESSEGGWAMELSPVSDRFEDLRKQVQKSWKSGDADAAMQRFDSAVRQLDDSEAALLACSVGKVVLAAGNYDRVLEITKEVADSPVVSCVGKASLLAAYIHIYPRPDFNAAEQSLQAAEAVQGGDLDSRIGAAYLRGVLEHWLGDIDESLLNFEWAARLAWLVADDDQYASALVMQAITLARLGRFEEAEELAVEAEGRSADLVHPTLALDIRSTVAWIATLRREDNAMIPDPSPVLREMIAEYTAHGDDFNVANRRLELALALIQNANLEAASVELAKIDASVLDSYLLVWFEIASARVDALQDEFRAAEGHLDRASLLAELNQDNELDWRVAIEYGELELARGRRAAARERFADASRLADALAMAVAGDAGRSMFVTSHSRADIALIELLLERGDVKEAMCTAMAARARHLRGLWARMRPALEGSSERKYRDLISQYRSRKQSITAELQDSWELSTNELSALRERLAAESERADDLLAEATALLEDGAPTWSCERALPATSGQAVLTMAPSSNGNRWTAMLAVRAEGGQLMVESASFEAAERSPAAVAEAMLVRFSDSLLRSKQLRVIPMGEFVSVEFHQIWLRGGHLEPLITYSLGLGTIDEPSDQYQRTASVIAGSSDLGAVAREATSVAQRLAAAGWSVADRWDPESATQPTLLHYAGHGFAGAKLGWDSALELPGVGKVSATQVVAGQYSPEFVVLGACSAGRVSSESIDGGMNLAAAFLLAGAQLVIAPTRDVDDEAAFELGLGLYRDLGTIDADEIVAALARIQREQLQQPAVAGARSFSSWRAWTP